MAAKLTRLTQKIAIQLHLVAESSTIFSSRSRRPVRKFCIHPRTFDGYILVRVSNPDLKQCLLRRSGTCSWPVLPHFYKKHLKIVDVRAKIFLILKVPANVPSHSGIICNGESFEVTLSHISVRKSYKMLTTRKTKLKQDCSSGRRTLRLKSQTTRIYIVFVLSY
jgi:hypothetical protein